MAGDGLSKDVHAILVLSDLLHGASLCAIAASCVVFTGAWRGTRIPTLVVPPLLPPPSISAQLERIGKRIIVL